MSANIFDHDEGLEHVEGANLVRGPEGYGEGDEDDIIKGLQLELSEQEDSEDEFLLSVSDDDLEDQGEDDLDEDYDFRDALRSASNFRSRKKTSGSKLYWKRKMMRSTNRALDPVVLNSLSRANEAFVRHDFQAALNLYLEVIKKDPKNFSAYKTIGEIYKLQGRIHECCNYWFLAANIHPWDSPFWASVAELSSELGHIDQAIHCYTRAISADNTKNPKYLLDRALLYKEKKQYGRALEGLQRVHQAYPTDSAIVKNLASVYVEQKRLNDAINLYMRILDGNMNPGDALVNVPRFGWAELNILCELYVTQHAWKVGIRMIKLVARWLQHRENEKWWDDTDDDSEFDNRRFEVLASRSVAEQHTANSKVYELPIDIRFKLGSLRLGLDQKREAILHFNFLLDQADDIADLHFEAGKELEAQGYNREALDFLTRAYESEDQRSPELILLMGKCYLEVGDYIQAKHAYSAVLEEAPDNVDVKLALIEALYHLGEVDVASQLLTEVSKATHASADIPMEDEEVMEDDNLALIKNKQLTASSRTSKPSDEERMEIENNAKRKVLEKYHRMNRLEESVLAGDHVAAIAWIKLASQLVEMFMRVRSFFPRDKNRLFKGIILYKRRKQMGVDEKLARVYNLYEGIGEEQDNSRHELTAVTEYRGLTYGQWFVVFVQYAILLAKYDKNVEYAVQVVEIAQDVSVFIQDKNKATILKLVRLLFGIELGDLANVVSGNVRHFLATNQFSPFIYKLFMCCFPSGINAWNTMTNYNHQKFFLRQLKAYDSIVTSSKISGMATINADISSASLTGEHPELLYIYANLLGGSRSFASPVVYLNRVYKEFNKDPMICLVLGLSHVHRSMQRLSTNRHIQLLQGISYILEYKELRGNSNTTTWYELQEIEYNLARLLHMLGLTGPAITHYENVLKYHGNLQLDPDFDLLVDAAYNMSLIYSINGNTLLARSLTEKYLTV